VNRNTKKFINKKIDEFNKYYGAKSDVKPAITECSWGIDLEYPKGFRYQVGGTISVDAPCFANGANYYNDSNYSYYECNNLIDENNMPIGNCK
jgi:hypothetical protein